MPPNGGGKEGLGVTPNKVFWVGTAVPRTHKGNLDVSELTKYSLTLSNFYSLRCIYPLGKKIYILT
jgi:hypothetical protein